LAAKNHESEYPFTHWCCTLHSRSSRLTQTVEDTLQSNPINFQSIHVYEIGMHSVIFKKWERHAGCVA